MPLYVKLPIPAVFVTTPLICVLPLPLKMTVLVTAVFEMFNPPRDATRIYVIAKQWMWKVQHPQGRSEINEIHVPLGKPVQLIMTSQDVIHSFFVPAFRIHQDVLPNRYTTVWFEATKPGKYHLFCSQYCGTNHAKMIGEVIVMPPKVPAALPLASSGWASKTSIPLMLSVRVAPVALMMPMIIRPLTRRPISDTPPNRKP